MPPPPPTYPGPFLTTIEFFIRVDNRWIAKNILDNGTAATLLDMNNPVTPAGIVLNTLINEAVEEMFAACSVAARYSISDLQPTFFDMGFTQPAYPGGGQLMKGLLAGLVIGKVLPRRVRAVADDEKYSTMYNKSMWYMEQLRRGERIFALVPLVPQAGLPTEADMNPIPGIDPPLITQVASRYFGLCNPLGGQSWGN